MAWCVWNKHGHELELLQDTVYITWIQLMWSKCNGKAPDMTARYSVNESSRCWLANIHFGCAIRCCGFSDLGERVSKHVV